MNSNNAFEGFDYTAEQLHKFRMAAGIFTISLKSGKIIHYSPEDVNTFRDWLIANGVTDTRTKRCYE